MFFTVYEAQSIWQEVGIGGENWSKYGTNTNQKRPKCQNVDSITRIGQNPAKV
jgi:hypothetical protein